jgi:hypothetical protein
MRDLIDTFDRRYLELNDRSAALIKTAGDERLYLAAADGNTVGELILRSAGAVEQMIGGVTRRLWDDPFEWTLRERMRSVDAVIEYLEEVEATRKSGFLFFRTDEDLNKTLPAPVQMQTLFEVLEKTLIRAEQYYAKAETLLVSLTN